MHEALVQYFAGEKQSAQAWGAAGMLAAALAVAVWRLAPAYRAMIVPLALVGVIQLGLAGALGLRTDGRVARLTAELRADPAALTARERTRIGGVRRGFLAAELVEVALWLTGAGLAFAGAGRARPTMLAVGIGLVLQASVMFAIDLTADRRARAYAAEMAKRS